MSETLKEAREKDLYLLDNNSEEFEKMEECYRYVTYDQWDPGLKAELVDKKRPALTIDLISPLVNTMFGIERDFRSGLEGMPMEGGDQDTAAIVTYILKFFNRNHRIEKTLSRSNKDVYICGIGWTDNHIRMGDDFLNEIDPRWESPFRVRRDPQGLNIDQSDWNLMARDRWMTDKQIKAGWPDADIRELSKEMTAEELRGVIVEDDKDYFQGRSLNIESFLDHKRLKRRVWEIYERMHKREKFIFNTQNGQVRSLQQFMEDPQTQQAFAFSQVQNQRRFEPKDAREMVEFMTAAGVPGLGVIEKFVTEIHMGIFTTGSMLQKMEKLPYNHGEFPIVPTFGYVAHRRDGRIRTHGIVQGLIDLQDEKNKRRSQALDILSRSNKGGGYYRQNQGFTIEDLQAMQITGNWVGMRGKISETIQERDQAHLGILGNIANLEGMAEADIAKSSGMPDPLQGRATNSKESGILAQTRIQQGLKGVTELAENADTSRITIYKQCLSYAQQYFTEDKMSRIIGTEDLKVSPQAIQQFLQNFRAMKYDVALNPEKSPTARRWNLQKFIEMLQFGVPPQLLLEPILELSDAPGKDKILASMQQMQPQLDTSNPSPSQ